MNPVIAYQGSAPMTDINKQTSPTAMFTTTPSQKKGAKSDRFIDANPSEMVSVGNALLADQIKNTPASKNNILFIAEY